MWSPGAVSFCLRGTETAKIKKNQNQTQSPRSDTREGSRERGKEGEPSLFRRGIFSLGAAVSHFHLKRRGSVRTALADQDQWTVSCLQMSAVGLLGFLFFWVRQKTSTTSDRCLDVLRPEQVWFTRCRLSRHWFVWKGINNKVAGNVSRFTKRSVLLLLVFWCNCLFCQLQSDSDESLVSTR